MAKIKNKQSQSPKPSPPIIQHDAFISKNKKRKQKRNQQKLAVDQAKTGDFIPVKKNALKPLQLSGLSKKPQLSTSLPIKGKKKEKHENANHSIATSNAFGNIETGKKVTGILSNPNTPKRNKNDHVKFDESVKKAEEPIVSFSGKKSQKKGLLAKLSHVGKTNVDKFLDVEADEGEEPINDKVNKSVKAYEKKSLKRKQVSESSDESEDDDDGSVDAEDFLDMEASEGEETDGSEDIEESDADESDDDEISSSENTYLSNFIDDDDEEDEDDSDEDDGSENDEEDDDDDDDESEDDEESVPTNKKVITPSKVDKKSINIETPAKKISLVTPSKLKGKSEVSEPLQTPLKGKGKAIDSEPSANPTPLTPSKVKGKTANLETASKEKSTTPSVAEAKVAKPEKKKKDQKKKDDKSEDVNVYSEVLKNEKSGEKLDKPSDFIGFIRKLPTTVTEKDIKETLSRVLDEGELLKVMFAKNRRDGTQNAFIYVKDAKSLGNLVHEKFEISGSLCAVYRARSSAAEESPPSPPEPVAFLPRVPQWITEEELKIAVEKEIGAGKVTEMKERRFIKSLQTRNILMTFVDADALKKAILKGDFKIKNHTVIVREAMEGVQVPIYRAVFSNVPEGTDEATLKKALESNIGKKSIVNVRFSFRKHSYVFVVFKDEETMKKALAVGDTISLNGTKLRVQPYTPRKPRKRAPPNEHAKAKQAEKRKQKPEATEGGKQKSKSRKPNPKKQKLENGSLNTPKKQNKSDQQQPNPKKPKLNDVSSNIPTTPNSTNKNKKVKQQFDQNKKKQDNDSSSVAGTPNSPNKQKKNKNKNKSSIVASTGEVKATKNVEIKQKQNRKPSFSASPIEDKKISPLKGKIQAKKDKLKNRMKQQQKKKQKSKQSM